MANYKSSYTGAEIDAGIAKANTALQEHQDISGKVDKETDKGLSTNDYTTAEKTKLAGIDMSTKQDTLVSGTNIKTINNESLLGEGNITIGGSGTDKYLEDVDLVDIPAQSETLEVDETNTTYVENPTGTIADVPAVNNNYGYVTFKNKKITYTAFDNGPNLYIIIARTTNGIVIVNGGGNAYYVQIAGNPSSTTSLKPGFTPSSSVPLVCTVADDGSTFTMGSKTYTQSEVTTALGNLDTFVKFTNGISKDKVNAATVSYTLPTTEASTVLRFTMNDTTSFDTDVTELKEGTTPEADPPLKGLKWNALGDSITDGSHGGLTNASQTYYGLICERQGMTYGNYGVSGTRISSTGTRSGNSFCNRYSNMSNDADIITVFGGVNDWGQGGTSDGACAPLGTFGDTTADTFYGAMDVLCKGLIAKYPTKTILFLTLLGQVGFSGWVNVGADSSINGGKNAENYSPWDEADAVKQVCGKYGIPVLDLLREANMTPLDSTQRSTYYSDGLHPTKAGHKRLADIIEKKLIEIYKKN